MTNLRSNPRQEMSCDAIKVYIRGYRKSSLGLATVFAAMVLCESDLPDYRRQRGRAQGIDEDIAYKK
jgi:hypothetical protein